VSDFIWDVQIGSRLGFIMTGAQLEVEFIRVPSNQCELGKEMPGTFPTSYLYVHPSRKGQELYLEYLISF